MSIKIENAAAVSLLSKYSVVDMSRRKSSDDAEDVVSAAPDDCSDQSNSDRPSLFDRGIQFYRSSNPASGSSRSVNSPTTTTSTSRRFFPNRIIRAGRQRVGSDEERLRKSRKTIDQHLRRMGAFFGKILSLNSDGMCYFPYRKFIFVLEVPPEHPTLLYFYTMVWRLDVTENHSEILKKAMELNYMEHATRGATLGLQGAEVNLCYSCTVTGLRFHDVKSALEDFMQTATEVNRELGATKTASGAQFDSVHSA